MQELGQERLVIFTRYPEPGKTKTRLIPELGAVAAAELHRQMAEHTLAQVERLQAVRRLEVEICFSGGSAELMRTWLGDNWRYTPQSEGDLGDRMARSFDAAFSKGSERAVIIGTDCPQLGSSLLEQAFEALKHHDLVLGPAIDGGYYLIGLRHPAPLLFQDIPWSTETVLSQTVAIAQSLRLSIDYLSTLADVDYPADLQIWEQAKNPSSSPSPSTLHPPPFTPSLSLIIPVLNEENHLPSLLENLAAPGVEIIVVDGGSQDHTVELAQSLGALVIPSPPGRAQQMNRGAAIAQGDILLFLHADTHLAPDFATWVQRIISQPGVVAGAFELKIDGHERSLRWVEWGVKWRSRLLQLPYGDQAIFLRKSTFQQVGGFPELPIMEDFAFIRRLRKLGKVAIAPVPILTSARRWQKLGVIRTTLINQLVILAYYLGVSPRTIARRYRQNR
jgi:rSAM/selenodomain-associated transferase 2/rSAM/selenodomain-associated transferase 1